MKTYYAVVYRKNDPWPIRHICKMNQLPKTERFFWKWYYKNYVQRDDDAVEFFDTLDEAIKFENELAVNYLSMAKLKEET